MEDPRWVAHAHREAIATAWNAFIEEESYGVRAYMNGFTRPKCEDPSPGKAEPDATSNSHNRHEGFSFKAQFRAFVFSCFRGYFFFVPSWLTVPARRS
jgi:hypothetical protein